MDPSMQPKENPPPYSEVPGGPPPPGFAYPVHPQPVFQPITMNQTIPPNQQYYVPSAGQYPGQTVVVTSQPATQHTVIMTGGCPVCRVGVLTEGPSCAAICLCFLFFPLGLIYLCLMTEKRCSNCGARF